jgi:hypothetical protein
MTENPVTIKLFRDAEQSRGSDTYELEVEEALRNLGLPELRGTSEQGKEGYFHRETGPEIVALAASIVGLATAIVSLVSAWKARHKEAEVQVQVVVHSPEELERVLAVFSHTGAES